MRLITEDFLQAIQADIAMGMPAETLCKRYQLSAEELVELRKDHLPGAGAARQFELRFLVLDQGLGVPVTASYGEPGKVGLTYREAHELVDRALLPELVARYDFNITRLAQDLQVSRRMLRDRLAALGLYDKKTAKTRKTNGEARRRSTSSDDEAPRALRLPRAWLDRESS